MSLNRLGHLTWSVSQSLATKTQTEVTHTQMGTHSHAHTFVGRHNRTMGNL